MISDEDCGKILNKIFNSNIKKSELGFNNEQSCREYIFPILVHCMENINVFDEKRLEKLNNITNKLIYG